MQYDYSFMPQLQRGLVKPRWSCGMDELLRPVQLYACD